LTIHLRWFVHLVLGSKKTLASHKNEYQENGFAIIRAFSNQYEARNKERSLFVMNIAFLDSTILLHHLLDDVPELSARCSALLQRIEDGKVQVRTSDTVIIETVVTLERGYEIPKHAIAEALQPLIALPGIKLPEKRRYPAVFDRYVRLDLPFVTAYHTVLMQELKLTEILSCDRAFKRMPGLMRREP
jgi:predicted nucleic acid-binding protein